MLADLKNFMINQSLQPKDQWLRGDLYFLLTLFLIDATTLTLSSYSWHATVQLSKNSLFVFFLRRVITFFWEFG